MPPIETLAADLAAVLIVLLAGGTKMAQAKDIKAALRLARDLSESPP